MFSLRCRIVKVDPNKKQSQTEEGFQGIGLVSRKRWSLFWISLNRHYVLKNSLGRMLFFLLIRSNQRCWKDWRPIFLVYLPHTNELCFPHVAMTSQSMRMNRLDPDTCQNHILDEAMALVDLFYDAQAWSDLLLWKFKPKDLSWQDCVEFFTSLE